jgi:NDP-sugar pyrophosphorylase family protein
MIDILGKPLLHHIIESLPLEITELLIVIGYKGDQIENYFGKRFEGRSVTYVHQEKPLGTAMALELCRKYLSPGERFLFLFADDLHSKSAIQGLLKHSVGMLVHEHSDPSRFGVVEVDEGGRVLGFEEKPKIPKSNLVSPGVFVLDTRIFAYAPIQHENGEYFLTSQVAQFIKDGEMLVEKTDFWHPIGYPDDVASAEAVLLKASGGTMPENSIKVIILAGGRGTRMPESEKHLPKLLVDIAGKPILEHQLENLTRQGFRNITLSLGYRAEEIVAWLAAKQFSDINYVIETEPLGTGGGIKLAARDEKTPFLVLNGDVLADFNFRSALRASGEGEYGVISVLEIGDVSGMGVVECDEYKRMCAFREKEAEKIAGLISAGLYVLQPDDIASMPDSFSIEHELFPRVALDRKFVVHEHRGNYWFDCGTEERLRRVREYFTK